METSVFLDWISVTHHNTDDNLFETMPRDHISSHGYNGYTVSRQYGTNVLEMFNPSDPRMGIHIIYSGKALALLETDYQISRDELLSHHVNNGGKISRIDITVDAIDSGLDLNHIWQLLETGKAKSGSSHSKTESGNGQGYTVYVGSRKTRRKMVRIYDKAKEQKWNFVDHKRIELELRREPARNAVDMYIESGMDISSIKSMIKAVIDFPDYDIWNDIFDAESLKIPVSPSGDGNTEKWLLNQVAPALAKTLINDSSFLTRFMSRVNYLIDDMKNTESTEVSK